MAANLQVCDIKSNTITVIRKPPIWGAGLIAPRSIVGNQPANNFDWFTLVRFRYVTTGSSLTRDKMSVLPVLWCGSCVWGRLPPTLPHPVHEGSLPPAVSVTKRKYQHMWIIYTEKEFNRLSSADESRLFWGPGKELNAHPNAFFLL